MTKTAHDLQIRGFSAYNEQTEQTSKPSNIADSRSRDTTTEMEAIHRNDSSIPGPSSARKRRRTSTMEHFEVADGSTAETECSTLDDILTNATEGYFDLDSVKIEPDEYDEEESWLIDVDSENQEHQEHQEASYDQKPAFEYSMPTNLEVKYNL